jgi:hypothetical protein
MFENAPNAERLPTQSNTCLNFLLVLYYMLGNLLPTGAVSLYGIESRLVYQMLGQCDDSIDEIISFIPFPQGRHRHILICHGKSCLWVKETLLGD